MTQKCLWRGVLIVLLSLALVSPANATGPRGWSYAEVGAVLVAVGVAVVVVAVVVIHDVSKKRAITGCVVSGENGLTITDEKDKRIYALSGNTTGIKPGDRLALRGKRIRSQASDKTRVWEIKGVARDFGACQP